MEWIIIVVFAFIWAAVCKSIAASKALDEGFWFLMGLIFGLFAVIGVAIATSKK